MLAVIVVLVAVNIFFWALIHPTTNQNLPSDFTIISINNTPTPTPEVIKTMELDFVPVTAFNNFALADLSSGEKKILVQEEFVSYLERLSFFAEDSFLLEGVSLEKVESFLKNPDSNIYLVTTGQLKSMVRTLNVNGKVYFDYKNDEEWPIKVEVPVSIVSAPSEIFTAQNSDEIVVGGTVVLSRGVAERIEKYKSSEYPWNGVHEHLTNADYAFINFKGSITSNCQYDGYTLRFCGQPGYLSGMVQAGVDGVSVSGNHIGDYGQNGMRETIEFLDEYEIAHTGLGRGYADAFEPIVVTLDSGKSIHTPYTVAFVAYNNVFGSAPCAGETATSWGVTCLLDREEVAQEIADLKEQYDVVIAYPNWGPEYTHYPDAQKQIAWGRLMVDAGADLILGDQAHWVQTMEFYQDAPIFYGLGNLVFDQMWSDKTREGILVRVFLYDGKIISLLPIPTQIQDYAQPQVAQGSLGRSILNYLALPVESTVGDN